MRGLTVVQRVLTGFFTLGLVLVALGVFTLRSLDSTVAKNETAYGELLPLVNEAQTLPQHLFQLQNALTQFLFAETDNQAQMQALQTRIDESLQTLAAIRPSGLDLSSELADIEASINTSMNSREEVVSAALRAREIEAAREVTLQAFIAEWELETSSLGSLQIGASASAARGYRQFSGQVASVDEFAQALAETRSTDVANEEKEVLERVLSSTQAVIERLQNQGASVDQLQSVRNKLDNFVNDPQGFAALHNQWLAQQQRLLDVLARWQRNIIASEQQINELAEQVESFASAQRQETAAQSASVRRWTAFGVLGALIFTAITGWRTLHSIRQPLAKTLSALRQVSEGDFTVKLAVSGRDEFSQIGNLVNHLTQALAASIVELRKNAESLSESASQSLNQADQARAESGEQKDQAQSIATAVNEMESAISEVAGATNEARDEVDGVKELANKGERSMQDNIDTIAKLDGNIVSANETIGKLAEQTQQITQILDVIGGIAEQTNLLALNAAIEAARAGESGRGFAVVADEVRSLADKTHQSTGEIQTMISALTEASTQARAQMDTANQSMQVCVDQSNVTATAMQEIDAAMVSVQRMAMQIATAAEEQSAVAREVNQNVVGVADLAESGFERAQSNKDASEFVSRLASEQTRLIAQFKC